MRLSLSVFSVLATAISAQYLGSSHWKSEPKLRQHVENRAERPIDSNQWPHGPFTTKGRNIVNNRGDTVTWAGVNWPMSGETMIPEGLEWASAEEILDLVASVGWNYIRMGYAIEMVDQIYDRGGNDVPLEVAMVMALGYVNGTKVTDEIIARNPRWTRQTTRFQIWSDITSIAAEKGIFISPDVHVHKAQWCCSHTDGNAWFDDVYFNTTKWRRGLAYVAKWAKSHPNVVSMSLRNELRESWNVTNLYYNWQTFIGNMSAGADAIHAANPDVLILWSGLQYDQDLSALTTRKNVLDAPCYKCTAIRDAKRRDPVYFDLDSYPWANKVVWELHIYKMSEDQDTGVSSMIEANLFRNGFNALGIDPPSGCNVTGDCPPAQRLTPVILSEFGNAQDATLLNDTLQQTLRSFTTKHGISWMVWGLAGSYRVRSGGQGVDDTWGLTNYQWTDWRYQDGIEKHWKPWIKAMNVTRPKQV